MNPHFCCFCYQFKTRLNFNSIPILNLARSIALKMEEPIPIATFKEAYKAAATTPIPLNARYFPLKENNFAIESTWSIFDFGVLKKSIFNRSYFGSLVDEYTRVLSRTAYESSSVKKVAYAQSGGLKAVLHETKGSDPEQVIQVWTETGRVYSYDVVSKKEHGKIYDDSRIGAMMWNDFGNTLLYVAEQYLAKPSSYFKETTAKEDENGGQQTQGMGAEFVHQDDWGETFTKKSHPVFCSLEVPSGKVTVFPVLENQPITIAQPLWFNEGKSIYFIGYEELPLRLGLVFCVNRLSKLFCYDIESNTTTSLTGDGLNVRSPRLSPRNKVLVYLQTKAPGPHSTCSQLMKLEDQGKISVVVDIVKSAQNNEFPGIYALELPERCFSKDGQYVFLSSMWRSREVALCINLNTGKVQALLSDESLSSVTVLDVFDDSVVVSACSPNIEPFLMVGKVSFENENVSVKWIFLDDGTPRKIPHVDWTIHKIEPEMKNLKYPHIDYDAIFITPSAYKDSVPIILMPHGGPHSVMPACFSIYITAFVQLGYAACIVNYRGSTGYGTDGVNSLLGNIGTQDVSDVHQALEHVISKDNRLKNSQAFLFGGSHGGFLVAHLSAKYPEKFSACVSRNPVVDIPSMVGSTDIPDWTFCEAGIGELPKSTLADKAMIIECWEKSPIKYISQVKTPTLLHLGSKDRRVPMSNGLEYYRALKAMNVPTKAFIYDDNHTLTSFPAQTDGFMQTMIWFHTYKSKEV